MLLPIIGFILSALIYLYIEYKNYERYEAMDIMVTLVCGLAGFTCGLLASGLISQIAETEVVTIERKLVNLQDSDLLTGSFYLGSGDVNNERYFAYYFKEGTGFKYAKAPAKDTKIFYTKDEPKLVIEKTVFADSWDMWVFFPCKVYYYNFYVPTGTVKNNYNLGNR